MLWMLLMLIIGLAVLVKSSDVTISQSVKLSKLMGITQMTVGFIFIAVATSLPEMAVSVVSSLQGEGILGISTLLGANIADITLVIAAMAFTGAFALRKNELDDMVHIVLITSIIMGFAFVLGKIGIVFGLFCIIIFYVLSKEIVTRGVELNGVRRNGIFTLDVLGAVFLLLVSIALVILSAKFVTDSAIGIARLLGIHETLIGIFLAIGTTLPEMSVSVMAIRKGNPGLALGNVMGSLLANMTLILGIIGLLSVTIIGSMTKAVIIGFLVVNAVFLMAIRKRKMTFTKGALLLAVYIAFMLSMLILGVAG